MTQTHEKVLLTGDDVLRMPESLTTGMELIEGALVKMGPTGLEHGEVENNVAFALTLYHRQHRIGRVLTGEVGFYTRPQENTTRAADVAFITYARLPKDADTSGYGRIAPELVVEVISPGNSAEEMDAKIHEWLAFGVQLVWVVYPSSRRVHVFAAPDRATILNADDTLTGGDVLPGFSVKVSEFF